MQIEFKKIIDVKEDVDVFVAGGGPAGIAAAVTAARLGAKVYLAEKEQCFGGMGTAALVPAFMRFSDGVNFLAGGIGREIFNALYGENEDYTTIEFSIDVEKLKLVYDEMMVKAGVKFSFETNFIDVAVEDGLIHHAILKGKEELFAVRAKIYIDATGDGILAVKAGALLKKGDENGRMMPATLCTYWGDIDWSTAKVILGKDPDNRMLQKAFEDGVFTVKDPSLPGMWRFNRHYGGGNIGHVFEVDGTHEDSITKGIIEARKRMKEYQYYYNHYLEGYENAAMLMTGHVLGIRETRRIKGEYCLNIEDYFTQADFEDEIGRYCYPIDIHRSRIDDKPKYPGIYQKGYEKGKSYGIPYRCLLPKDTKNLLVAGRCISTDREMLGSMRVMPACYITGMASGAAAALSAINEQELRKLDVKKLQKVLKEMGAFLPNI